MSRPAITVYGTTWCGGCRLAKRVLDDRGTAYAWVDIEQDPAGQATVQRLNDGMQSVPTIVFADGSVLVEPSAFVLTKHLDLLGA